MKTICKNILSRLNFMILTTLLFACSGKESESGKSEVVKPSDELIEITEAQYKNVGIELGKIEIRSMSGRINVNGMLDVPPQNLVTISVPFGGTVKQTDLLQGMKVVKGQTIVVLEHPDYIQLQQDYLDTKSKLNFMELELKRQEDLQKGNVNSAKEYQKAVSDYESLKSKSEGLEIKLSMLNISVEQLNKTGIVKQIKLVAPINGYVTDVNINIGSYVNQNDVICRIVDTRHLHVELTVFEKDVRSLKVGQKVHFSFNNESEERLASVYLIGREISPDRTVRVHCHIDKEDQELLPGMYLKAIIETQTREASVVPSEAIVQMEGKDYVFALKETKKVEGKQVSVFKKYEVLSGVVNGGYTELSFLNEFDKNNQVVLKGAYDLLSKIGIGEAEEE